MVNYIILLPPSEGKNSGGDKPLSLSFEELTPFRNEVLGDLKGTIKSLDDKSLMKVFKVKNLDDIKNFDYSKKSCLKAIDRFSGVMFKAIDYDSLGNKANFDEGVVFVDALFGLLKPKDFIFDYKLMMGTKLKNVKTDRFWKERLRLEEFDFFKNKIIIDLLPNIHRESVDLDNLDVFSVNFFEKSDSDLKNVGHKSKKLKGEFIRFICSKDDINVDDFKSFKHSEGFVFCKESSDLSRGIVCFVR
ncbi:MAG: YaaA family protein [Candidatus Woesearchaeota archaeon]